MPARVRWEAACEVGCVRSKNEDAWGATAIGGDSGPVLLAVADGMGGHPGGDVASRLAIEACLDAANEGVPDRPIPEWLSWLFRRAKERLHEHAGLHPTLRTMGTTLTVLLVQEDGGWVGHLGDTRLLWARGDTIGIVTRDHSAAWERVEKGTLSLDQAERDPMGALLTRHLGPFSPCDPDIFELPLALAKGDRLLLCSDGLGKVVSMEEVISLTAPVTIKKGVSKLIDAAIEAGGPDNITVILAELIEGDGEPDQRIDFDTLPFRFEASY